MTKQKSLSDNLEKMIDQETLGNNFTGCLVEGEESYEVNKKLKAMRNFYIQPTNDEYIPIENYIDFYEQTPHYLWSQIPVHYFRDGKWDALGLIGEKIHNFNLESKTLGLYFNDCIKISITKAIDGEDPIFAHITDYKERFIKYLYYIKENCEEDKFKTAYAKSRKIITGRYC